MLLEKKYQKIFILLFIVFLGLVASSPALALEVKYPAIPGLPNINTGQHNLGEYISYFFGIIVYLAGILSLISFAVGAVIFIASAESPEIKKSAQARMKGAALGLILVLASFLILRTINLNLITPSITPLAAGDGVYLTDGTNLQPAPSSVNDTSTLESGYDKITYNCKAGPALLIWEFSNTGLENNNDLSPGTSEVKVKRINCGDQEDISEYGSFKLVFETPGVYYCLGGCGDNNMCSGYMSDANTSSQDAIDSTFAGQIGAVRIVNDVTNNLNYGIILHEKSGLQNGGQCNAAVSAYGQNSSCSKIPSPEYTFSADIFNPSNSSSGEVDFFSEPFGWTPGANAGFFSLTVNGPNNTTSADAMTYNYSSVDRPTTYENLCKTFQSCPGSIKIKQNSLILLSSDSGYCQTFTQDVPNLKVQAILNENTYPIDSVQVFLTK